MLKFARVLIVDDSAMMRAIIKKSLTMARILVDQIVEAADGSEVPEVLRSLHVDLMFCDLNMPKLNGDDLIRSFPSMDDAHIPPVIVVSSEASNDRITNLNSPHVIGVIRKPFAPEKLLEILETQNVGN